MHTSSVIGGKMAAAILLVLSLHFTHNYSATGKS